MEARQLGVVGASALPPGFSQGGASGGGLRGSRGWGSSPDEDEHYRRNRVATPWVSSSSYRPLTVMSVSPLRQMLSSLLASSHHQLPTQIAVWLDLAPCSTSRRATHTSHLFNDCEPTAEFLDRLLRRSPGPALRVGQSDQTCHRQVANFVVEPRTSTWF